MIIDLNNLDQAIAFQADLCIIGAGAAGIALAREFIHSPHSVILLESGGHAAEPESQALYDSEVIGYPHNGVHRGRARVFGGTTTLWAGQALPLDTMDFTERAWVPNSGWPLSRQQLEPFYLRAEKVMGLEPHDYMSSAWPETLQSKLQFDRKKFRTLSSQFSRQPNFEVAYRKELLASPNVTVVLHANATCINSSENGSRADSLSVASLCGKQASVLSRFFVICCGGIESARLLLVSDAVHKNGFGNQNDIVGRYFQDHVQAATLAVQNGWSNLRLLHDARYVAGVARSPKLAASEQLQQSEGILNATVGITYDGFVEQNSPVESAKRVIKSVLNRRLSAASWADARRAAAAPHQILAAGYRRFIKGQPAFRMHGTPHIGIQCECAPIPTSRVTLSKETDRLGVRRTRLDWRLSPLVLKTVSAMVRAFAAELTRLGAGTCNVDNIDSRTAADWGLFDANHHIGATRISANPAHGVVDANCRIHAIDNVYIGSSSVFPTSGHSNPTLTILALVMRMADHLKEKLQSTP